MEREHGEVINALLDVAGKRVLDIGCGNGHIARLITKLGGRVTGIDPGEKQLERARDAAPAGDETYVDGVAEDLPFDDGSVDIVVFFNSLHHITVENMASGLAEAARVLKPGGTVFITEPLARGQLFEMQKPYNDETEVRARALAAIRDAGAHGLRQAGESFYTRNTVHESFEALRDMTTAVNPARRAKIDAMESELRANFDRLGDKRPDGYHFAQEIRVNLLEKL